MTLSLMTLLNGLNYKTQNKVMLTGTFVMLRAIMLSIEFLFYYVKCR